MFRPTPGLGLGGRATKFRVVVLFLREERARKRRRKDKDESHGILRRNEDHDGKESAIYCREVETPRMS